MAYPNGNKRALRDFKDREDVIPLEDLAYIHAENSHYLRYEARPGRLLEERHPLMPKIVTMRLDGAAWTEIGRAVGRADNTVKPLAIMAVELVGAYYGLRKRDTNRLCKKMRIDPFPMRKYTPRRKPE